MKYKLIVQLYNFGSDDTYFVNDIDFQDIEKLKDILSRVSKQGEYIATNTIESIISSKEESDFLCDKIYLYRIGYKQRIKSIKLFKVENEQELI